MMKAKAFFAMALAACGLGQGAVSAMAQGTAFTYQGRLNDAGSPATGSYDLRFSIYDAASGGDVEAGPLTNLATSVSNGLFTVSLDFGAGVFTGAPLWLEIDTRTNGAAVFITLTPRQALLATPYAITAGNLAGGGLSAGTYSNAVNFDNGANQYAGTYTGNGEGLTNVAGALAAQAVAGTTIQAVPNVSYVLTNSGLVSVTLPAAPNVGDVVRLAYTGLSGWQLLQNSNQLVLGDNLVAASGPWTQLLTNHTAVPWETIICSPDGTHVAAGARVSPGLITSENAGASWNFDGTTLVANNDNALCQSADGSTIISAWTGGLGFTVLTNYGSNLAYNLLTNNTILVAGATNLSHVVGVGNGFIFTTVPPWTNWVTSLAPSNNWSGLAMSADGSHCVATVNSGGIYTSTDFGTNWTLTPAPSSNAWVCVASSANGNQLVAGLSGTNLMYESANAGISWNQLSATNLPSIVSLACSADGTHLIAGNLSSTVPYISVDSGLTWAPANIPQHDNWIAVGCSAAGNFFAGENQEGAIFGYETATTTGTTGYLSGGPNTAVELEYMGNGVFLPVSHEGTLVLH